MDNFCQGFCTLCGTGCAQYCRDYRELRAERDRYKAALERIAVADGCEGYSEVLGGKLMEIAREALK